MTIEILLGAVGIVVGVAGICVSITIYKRINDIELRRCVETRIYEMVVKGWGGGNPLMGADWALSPPHVFTVPAIEWAIKEIRRGGLPEPSIGGNVFELSVERKMQEFASAYHQEETRTLLPRIGPDSYALLSNGGLSRGMEYAMERVLHQEARMDAYATLFREILSVGVGNPLRNSDGVIVGRITKTFP